MAYIDNLKVLKKKIDPGEKVTILKDFFESIKDSKKLNSLLEKSTKYAKQGRSGAVIYKNNDKILKISNLQDKNILKYEKTCIFIDSAYNEILLNYIFSNLKDFVSLNNDEKKLVDNYLFNMKDFVLDKKRSLLSMDLVGFNHNNSKYYSDLMDVLVYNFSLIETRDVYDLFIEFLIKMVINPIDSTLKILYKKLNFIHTDFKLENILVKKRATKGYQLLKNSGLIIDFIPLIADLDKGRIFLGDTYILSKIDSSLKYNVAKRTEYAPLIELRYQCKIDYGVKKCTKIDTKDFDMYCVLIIVYLIIIENKLIYSSGLDNYFKNRFRVDIDKFKKVLEKESKSFRLVSKYRTTNISKLIYRLCKI